MGKGGRLVFIALPVALSLAVVICLIIIGLGGLNSGSSFQSSLYFFRADTSGANSGAVSIDGVDLNGQEVDAAKQIAGIADQYWVYMWNYCSGDAAGNIHYCSPRTTSFWFDPQTVWHLSGSVASHFFSSELNDGLHVYQDLAKFAFICYVVAFSANAATLVVGVFAICSRWGSLATTIVASIALLFTIAYASAVTAMYAVLTGAFHTAFAEFDIDTALGVKALVVVWLACAFGIAAAVFWLISICCGSGRSRSRSRSQPRSEPKAYEPIPSPYNQPSPYPPSAYAPSSYAAPVQPPPPQQWASPKQEYQAPNYHAPEHDRLMHGANTSYGGYVPYGDTV